MRGVSWEFIPVRDTLLLHNFELVLVITVRSPLWVVMQKYCSSYFDMPRLGAALISIFIYTLFLAEPIFSVYFWCIQSGLHVGYYHLLDYIVLHV